MGQCIKFIFMQESLLRRQAVWILSNTLKDGSYVI